MLKYNKTLKPNARRLRKEMTDCEQLRWSRLRRKQIHDIQFYRQKPIGNLSVDFYAPKAGLVVELDGGQHFDAVNTEKDALRDDYLARQELRVLRFDNLQVMRELEAVLETIALVAGERLRMAGSGGREIPPRSLSDLISRMREPRFGMQCKAQAAQLCRPQ